MGCVSEKQERKWKMRRTWNLAKEESEQHRRPKKTRAGDRHLQSEGVPENNQGQIKKRNSAQSTEKFTNRHLKDLLEYLENVVMIPNETGKIGGGKAMIN